MPCWEYRLKTAAKLIGVGSGVRLLRPAAAPVEADFAGLHGLNWPVGTSEPLRQTEFREQRGVEKGHQPRHPVGPQSSTCSWNGTWPSPSRMYIAAAGWPLALSGTSRISPGSSAGHC